MNLNSILIFVKVPLPGLVKTRLSDNTCLSENDVATLAEAMLKDTIVLASKSKSDLIEIGYYPEFQLKKLKTIIEDVKTDGFLNKEVVYFLQHGSNFDQRFASVVDQSLSIQKKNLILLGADLPYLDHKVLNSSFDYLTERLNKRVIVLGPASEGGIYLIGINNSFKSHWFSKYQLFRGGIELIQFKNLCKSKEFHQKIMPFYTDIDLEADLITLVLNIELLKQSHAYEGFHFPQYTAQKINNLGLVVKQVEEGTRNRKLTKGE